MAAMIENGQLGVGIPERLLIGSGSGNRHCRILAAPDDMRRQTFYALQEERQAGVVQNRIPGEARAFGAGFLEGLELLGGALAAVELAELGRRGGVVNGRVELRADGDGEDVEDLAF